MILLAFACAVSTEPTADTYAVTAPADPWAGFEVYSVTQVCTEDGLVVSPIEDYPLPAEPPVFVSYVISTRTASGWSVYVATEEIQLDPGAVYAKPCALSAGALEVRYSLTWVYRSAE